MKLEKLFLRKEELPILYEQCFQIPIHPKLLDENINIGENIAQDIFPQVAEEWYEDLTNYVKTLKDKQKKEWIEDVFLNEKPKIIKEYGEQTIENFNWKDETRMRENSFVTCFSINRNSGGSLYFDKEELNCGTVLPTAYLKFSKEKVKAFEYEKVGKHSIALVCTQHNTDSYPGALFLRNWAIKYMNEVFKEVFS